MNGINTGRFSASNDEDNELVVRACNGDQDAWFMLMKRHKAVFWREVNRAERGGCDHDDAVSAAGEQFMKAVRTFDPGRGCSFFAHLMALLTRQVFQRARESGNRSKGPVTIPLLAHQTFPDEFCRAQRVVRLNANDRDGKKLTGMEPTQRDADFDERRNWIEEAMFSLNDKQRQILVMLSSGFVLSEVAQALGVSKQAIHQYGKFAEVALEEEVIRVVARDRHRARGRRIAEGVA